MPVDLAALNLDWPLAARRLAKDIRDDFWPDPIGLTDVLGRCQVAIERLRPRLPSYVPEQNAPLYQIPKANFTLRDSLQLSPLDRLVYQALVDPLAAHIDGQLVPFAFSHRLRGPDSKWMFKSGVGQWKAFHSAVRDAVTEHSGSFIVATDLSQYFENVNFRYLRRHLEKLTAGTALQPTIDALHQCLRAWSPYNDHGLPQNIDASSFLGNALLDIVDRSMLGLGYRYFRYMDDMRIVVDSEAAARTALMRLIAFLREVGLGVNSSKTQIIPPGSSEMQEHLRPDDPEIKEIEDAIASKDRPTVQGVVALLYRKTRHLIAAGRTADRAFRFCVNRITSLRVYRNLDLPTDLEITDAVLLLLRSRPAESDTFCRYLAVAPLTTEHKAELERLLCGEPLCVYHWQNYQLWRLATQRMVVSPQLLQSAHEKLAASTDSPELGGAALYLGACGGYADREAVRRALGNPRTAFVERCMLIALQQIHPAERAETFRRFAQQSDESHLLTEHLASLAEPLYVAEPPPIQIEDLSDFMPSIY